MSAAPPADPAPPSVHPPDADGEDARGAESTPDEAAASARRPWLAPLLFVATAVSVVATQGPRFAAALLAILVTHEAGHYVASRRHGVPSSLPMFIPFPASLLGTLGAVIVMRGRIRSRTALFDIGASGPLAGLLVALPILAYGFSISTTIPIERTDDLILEGRSLLYVGLRTLVHGPLDEGTDLLLAPEAFAGWAGLLVTMINLVPVGQLDGGHVARSLFGPGYLRVEPYVHHALLVVGVWVSASAAFSVMQAGGSPSADDLLGMHWVIWWGLLHLVRRAPPIVLEDETPLGPARRALALGTLALFPLLFMPWWVQVG